MQKIYLPVSILLFAVLVQAGCKSSPKETSQSEDVIPVRILSLVQDSITSSFSAAGQFTTDDETILAFKNGGIIQRVYVKEGDAVSKGQLLATVNLTEVNAMVEQASQAYQKAKRDFERASNLYRDSVATLEQMQNAKTAMEVARQQYTSAGFNQSYSEIRADKSGYVLRRFANEGQVVGPGTPVLQINGAAAGKWILKAGVSDYQWAQIKPGDKAVVTTDVAPGKSFAAQVTKKSEGVDPQSGTFQVQLQLSEVPAGKLASGLFGKAQFFPSQSIHAWAVPYDALLDGDANNAYVFVTDDMKTARKVKVQVARVASNQVMISGGLEGVKALIISGSAYLNDGSTIRVDSSNRK